MGAGFVRALGGLALLFGAAANSQVPELPAGFIRTGQVADAAIDEISGIEPASARPGAFWGVNDSGNAPMLFAFDRKGAVLARVAVTGASNEDWEDLAAYDDDGRRMLVIGDIGDNLSWRRGVTLYFVAEPAFNDTSAAIVRTLNFTYEDGARDAESLAVDVRDRQFLVLEKRAEGAGLYALPFDAVDGAVAHRIATLGPFWPEPATLVLPFSAQRFRGAATAMDISPDGERLALLTYTHLLLYQRGAGSWAQALAGAPWHWLRLPPVPSFESVCFAVNGARAWIVPEGNPAPIFGINVEAAVQHAAAAPPATLAAMDFFPLLVHFGYTLMLCALLARDILWLRGTLVAAQSILALYAFHIGVNSIGGWNVVFVGINLVWVSRILRERRAVMLPDALVPVHEKHFAALSPPEFLRLWSWGQEQSSSDSVLTREGHRPAGLFFIRSGTVRVEHEGRVLARLGAGDFVGEMSLLTGEAATADARAEGPVTVMCWPSAPLLTLRARNPALWTRIQSVLGHDVVEKIRRASATA